MKTLFKYYWILAIIMIIGGCKTKTKSEPTTDSTSDVTIEETQETAKPFDNKETTHKILDIYGNYATESYRTKDKGSDWVGVEVRGKQGESAVSFNVKSRSDIKKPTCTYAVKAVFVKEGLYKAWEDEKVILFEFNGDKLKIYTEKFEDRFLLNKFCSGGGSLAGVYYRIKGSL